VGRIWGKHDWAAGEVGVYLPEPGGTEGTLVLALRQDGAWRVLLAGDPAFGQALEQEPVRYLPAEAADWFWAESGQAFSTTQGLYYIPYTEGTTVWASCVDCYPGHYPSIDFISWNGDTTIRAARDGTVASWRDAGDFCCCESGCSACNGYLVLDHGDGEYSAYLHLKSGSIPQAFRQLGAYVPRGAAIAQEGDTGYTCGSIGRIETGCAPVSPVPDRRCAQHTHFEVRDAPYPYGERLWPRFQDVYDQTDPPTYFVQQDEFYVSGNTPATPTPPTPTPIPLACPPPAASEGVYLFTEADYCGFFSRFTAADADLSDDAVGTEGVRSVHIAGPYTATLFGAPAFGGTAEGFLSGDSNLEDNAIATRTASLSVTLFTCPLITPGVVLYTAAGYGGACRHLTVSDADLSDDGIDGQVRSLRLIGPYSATLYAEAGFAGTALNVYSSTPDLSGCPISLTVSSIELFPAPGNVAAEGVVLCSAPAYAGTCRTFAADDPDLADDGLGEIGSLLIRGPLRAALYSEPAYSGTREVFLVSDADLGDNVISTTASSLAITTTPCRPWGEGVTLFAGPGYGGACATLTADDPDLCGVGLTGQVRSVRVRGPYRATLFSKADYTGTAEVFDRSDADLGDNPIGSTAVSVRVQAVTCTAGAGGVTLWAQPGYGGPCSSFSAVDADLSDDGIGTKNTFSLRVIGPYSVSLFPEAGLGGTRTVVLGDLPALMHTVIGTGTASLQVKPSGETGGPWNDQRHYAVPLRIVPGVVVYLQDLAPATAGADDPVLPCVGGIGEHTLWYRPLLSATAVAEFTISGPGSPALALWEETEAGLQTRGCVVGNGASLADLMSAGRPILLEVVTVGQEAGVFSLTVRRSAPWAIYLPLVGRR
jgi:murein DD-endopeptidase MepM/ murein hydrolase activator NlpD